MPVSCMLLYSFHKTVQRHQQCDTVLALSLCLSAPYPSSITSLLTATIHAQTSKRTPWPEETLGVLSARVATWMPPAPQALAELTARSPRGRLWWAAPWTRWLSMDPLLRTKCHSSGPHLAWQIATVTWDNRIYLTSNTKWRLRLWVRSKKYLCILWPQ